VVEKPAVASKHRTEGFCWAQRPSLSCFDMMRGRHGQKRPTVASKHKREALWAVVGSAEAKQKNTPHRARIFCLVDGGMCWWGWGRVSERGDMLVREGTC